MMGSATVDRSDCAEGGGMIDFGEVARNLLCIAQVTENT